MGFMKANNGGLAVPKQIKKKKIASLTNKKEPIRPVRPKVVPSKGAVQCMGKNLKKGTQCKNAALMEFFGPRPIYCAEHIELDPESIYCKCSSTYGKTPGDGKGCKEIVLKEFLYCYKHFGDRLASIPEDSGLDIAKKDHKRVSEILAQLESEAASAKRKRHDLFQRKNKLIPKFAKMLSQLEEFIAQREPAFGHNEPPAPKVNSPGTDNTSSPVAVPEATKLPFTSNLLDEEWKDLFVDDGTKSS